MRIEKLRFLEDYKCIQKGTEIDFSGTGNYCALVGLNGSGKTSVLNHLLNVILPHNNNLDSDCYYNSNIMDYISTDNGKLPKLVVHIYNGETKFGSRLSYREEYNMYVLQLDSSIWCLASFILQCKNDSLIDKFKIKSEGVANLIDKITKECDTDIDNELYNKTIQKDSRENKHKVKKINKNGEDDYLNCQIIETQRKQLIDRSKEDWDSLFWYKILSEIKLDVSNTTSFVLPENNHYVFRVIASYILSYYTNDDNEIYSVHSLQNSYLNRFYEDTTLQLSEGQKSRLVLQLVMKYLAVEENNTLVLLDEPDDYLDVQKRLELFYMIQECKGQVLVTTHDPIMTKWMKGHLAFMDNGKQLPSKMVGTIKELSGGEISYQETLLMFKKEYVVVVEGKSDLECIEKAIKSNGLNIEFEQVFFLAQNSASSTQATFDNFLCKLFENHNHIRHILFLYDADDAGYKGKKQIEKIKGEYNGKGISKIIDYLFYRPCYNSAENSSFDNNIKDYFYLEGYFPVDCYPANSGETINLIKHKELYDILDDKNEDKCLNFNEIIRLKFFAEKINKNGLKSYFGNHTDKIDAKYFIGFRPLLDKILEKLELPNEPTS